MSLLPDLRDFVREEPSPADTALVIRGGPDTVSKLKSHAERLRRAFTLDGAPALGISVFAALDDIGPASLDGIQASRLSTYRLVHTVPVGVVARAGYSLLPTFQRPHMTLLLDTLDDVDRLLTLLGPPQRNPRYGETRRRARRPPR